MAIVFIYKFDQPCFSIFLLIFKSCAKFKQLYRMYNIKWNFQDCINLSQPFLPEYNKIYLSVIASIAFTLHEIKQRNFFRDIQLYLPINITINGMTLVLYMYVLALRARLYSSSACCRAAYLYKNCNRNFQRLKNLL